MEGKGIVAAEVPFRALPEYDLRGADVAFVSQSRWEAADPDDNLHGSPELVIEVLSPSNTKAEIREKAALYLSTGAQEFWVVDPKRKTATVTNRAADAVVYAIGDRLPLLAVIGWAAFQQTQRLGRIESQLDELGKDLKSIGVRTATSKTKIAVIESKLNGPRIIAPAASR